MTTWTTFSNGEQACQTSVLERMMALRRQKDWPVIETKYVSGGWYYDWGKFTGEQDMDYKTIEKGYLQEELDAYINEKWPGQGISVTKREGLPYGASPSFGSGSRGGYFCSSPRTCAGHSSCPKRRACSE